MKKTILILLLLGLVLGDQASAIDECDQILSQYDNDENADYSSALAEAASSISTFVEEIETPNGPAYKVTIVQETNTHSATLQCSQTIVYQTANDPTINSERVGEPPALQFGENQIVLILTKADLDLGYCLKLIADQKTEYQCHFEIDILVKGRSMSKYFSLSIIYDGEQIAAQLIIVDTDVVANAKCDPAPLTYHEQQLCHIASNVSSELLFCQDILCVDASEKPYLSLNAGEGFLVKQVITDPQYQGLVIGEARLILQSFGLQQILDETQYEIVYQEPGFNIYRVTIPYPAEDFILIAQGLLNDEGALQPAGRSDGTDEISGITVNGEQAQSTDEEVVQDEAAQSHQGPLITVGATRTGEVSILADDGTPCFLSQNFLYQGQCLAKTCLLDKLSRVQLVTVESDNIGMLNLGIACQGEVVQSENGGSILQIDIKYTDQAGNELVSDPENCLDYRLYQTRNEFSIDKTRVNLVAGSEEGDKPEWPISTYSFDNQLQIADVQFFVAFNELDQYNCLKFPGETEIQYQCFFELAFVIKGVTQISYYFCFQVVINLGTASAVPAVNFVPIVQVERCSENCDAEIDIASTLLFCSDSTCTQTQDHPFFTLFLNRNFYMKHSINDPGFSQNWIIDEVILHYQALGFSIQLDTNLLTVTAQNAGFNIYRLRVPIVASDVLISATGNIKQIGHRSLQDAGQSQTTHTQANTGEVQVEPTDAQQAEAQNDDQDIHGSFLYIGVCLIASQCLLY